MDKNLYKSAVDQVAFDEQLEKKIINYLAENSGGKNMKRTNWKMKFSTSMAVAACTIFMVSVTGYAAVMHFSQVSHIENGLVAQNGNEATDVSSSAFIETSELRARMLKENSDLVLLTEEMGSSEVNWEKKTIWKDTTPAYYSNDGIEWDEDKTAPAGIMTQYAYSNYEMATKDAQMPNVMKKLLSKVEMNYGAFEEYATEVSADVSTKRVIGEFAYQDGKLFVDLSQELSNFEMLEAGVFVYTGVESATNQRTYQAQDAMTYQLSDQTNDGVTQTTTLVSNGDFRLIIQFEGLLENEIHTLLDGLDLSGLEM
ncbi:MAG: hypothetical protein ACRCS6_05580 [Turicibacter sp.]